MRSFKFKNKRTSDFNEKGERRPPTFNKSSKENTYINKNTRFTVTCKARSKGGAKGCTNVGCGKQCCLLLFSIRGIEKSYYETNNLGDILKVGKTVESFMLDDSYGVVGTIDDIIFPNACCQDPQGVLSCGDEDCEEESVEENCDCSKKDNYYNQIYNNGYCCDDNKNVFKYCDQTWPLSIHLIIKSESGSCANPNWNGNSLFIDNIEIKGTETVLDGYDTLGSSSKGSSYIMPIAGYRKVLADPICCLDDDFTVPKSKVKIHPKNNIYQDMHSQYTGKENVCYSGQIKSGLMPKPDLCCVGKKIKVASKCDKNNCIIKNNYSYDYNQYLNNKSGKGWKRSQEKFFPMEDGKMTSLGGVPENNCQPSEYVKGGLCACSGNITKGKTPSSKTVYKPNNRKFDKQGAVSSSSRLDRLKLNTIRASNTKCSSGEKCKTVVASNKKCSKKYKYGCSPYLSGKPRFTGWIYNKQHRENTCLNNPHQQPFGIPQLTNKKRSTSNYFIKYFSNRKIKKNNGIWQRKDRCLVVKS